GAWQCWACALRKVRFKTIEWVIFYVLSAVGPLSAITDRNAPLLFTHWELRYPYLLEATPVTEEGLLIPFYLHGKAVGTIWTIAHDASARPLGGPAHVCSSSFGLISVKQVYGLIAGARPRTRSRPAGSHSWTCRTRGELPPRRTIPDRWCAARPQIRAIRKRKPRRAERHTAQQGALRSPD